VTLQDIIAHLLALARAEEKGVRLRICQLLQLIINNQVVQPNGWSPLYKDWGPLHTPILLYAHRASWSWQTLLHRDQIMALICC